MTLRRSTQVASSRRASNQLPQFTDAQVEARVRGALTLVAAGDAHGIDDLFDAMGASVYTLGLLITGHQADAGDATAATFEHIWASRGSRSSETGSLSQWVLNVACQRARTLRTDRARESPDRTPDRTKQ